MIGNIVTRMRFFALTLLVVLVGLHAFADDKIYPDQPNPPRLVNDFAGTMSAGEQSQLEAKLDNFARTTSTQITIVTIKNLGGHDVEEYSVEVFNRWGLGQKGKNNGVLLLASMDDHKAWITTGSGLEGVLTDAKSGVIFRNELQPAFRQQKYYEGFSNTADAIIAVTKGEYKADGKGQGHHISVATIIIIIIILIFFIRMFGGGGGSGGGNYMSGRGLGSFAGGWFLGSMLGGGSGGWGGGGGDGGGGGFGGFGGGSSGGGGAGGSW